MLGLLVTVTGKSACLDHLGLLYESSLGLIELLDLAVKVSNLSVSLIHVDLHTQMAHAEEPSLEVTPNRWDWAAWETGHVACWIILMNFVHAGMEVVRLIWMQIRWLKGWSKCSPSTAVKHGVLSLYLFYWNHSLTNRYEASHDRQPANAWSTYSAIFGGCFVFFDCLQGLEMWKQFPDTVNIANIQNKCRQRMAYQVLIVATCMINYRLWRLCYIPNLSWSRKDGTWLYCHESAQ